MWVPKTKEKAIPRKDPAKKTQDSAAGLCGSGCPKKRPFRKTLDSPAAAGNSKKAPIPANI